MKKVKCLLVFMLLVGIILFVPNLSIAINNEISLKFISYEEFIKAQEDGYIGEDVTYKDMLELALQDSKLEEELNNNDSFIKVYDSRNLLSMAKAPTLKAGDVIITNATSSFGLTGHAAIAINSNKILDIPAPKKLVRTQTVSSFISSYKNGWIKVYRPTNSAWGSKAANWAKINYENSKATYRITTDINSTKETYCSKIVFQAYKFGVGRSAFNTYFHSQGGGYTANDYDAKRMIIPPYVLPQSLKIDYSSKLN